MNFDISGKLPPKPLAMEVGMPRKKYIVKRSLCTIMEDILDLYHEPYNPEYPVVCFDESSKQLVSEKRVPMPMLPGQVTRYDYEYTREGVRNLFMFYEPLTGQRHVEVTQQRTKADWVDCMQQLVDELYPSIHDF
jgi:hypothetical protein